MQAFAYIPTKFIRQWQKYYVDREDSLRREEVLLLQEALPTQYIPFLPEVVKHSGGGQADSS